MSATGNAAKFWAHVITSDAVGLGDPEVLIFSAEEGGGQLVAKYPEPTGSAVEAVKRLDTVGFRPAGNVTAVERGYYILPVGRV